MEANQKIRIELNQNQLFDFMKCPVFYDGVYNKKLLALEPVSMPKLLTKVSRFFFTNLMNGDVIPMSDLKHLWDRLCKKYPDYLTKQKCLEGINLISKLYKWAKGIELVIAGMSANYRLFIHGNNFDIGYDGAIETIAMQKKRKMEILVLDFNNKLPDQYLLDMKLKYTLDSLGYSMIQGENIGVHIHHVATNNDFFTFRNKDDVKRARSALENVAYCIHNNLFYPRENVFCAGCDMKYFCKGWK